MKRWIAAALALLLCVGCAAAQQESAAVPVSSQEEAQSRTEESIRSVEEPPPFEVQTPNLSGPILVTSLGQGTDALLVREILTDLEIDFTYEPISAPESLSEYQTVMLAVGASAKALGAGGLTTAEEFSRSELLLSSLPSGCTLVMIRLGDSSNQEQLTSDLITLTLPYADLILTTEDSDRDGVMENYARDHQIPYQSCGVVRKMGGMIEKLFSSAGV